MSGLLLITISLSGCFPNNSDLDSSVAFPDIDLVNPIKNQDFNKSQNAKNEGEFEGLSNQIESYKKTITKEKTKSSSSQTASPLNSAGFNMLFIVGFNNSFQPNYVEVPFGSSVIITFSAMDKGYGFVLPDFGINEFVRKEEFTKFEFIADKKGLFEFINNVPCNNCESMTGFLKVK
ncbi:hypothetical protein HN587_02300 [Candidatus Woesearchaeota archaeon]|nr:hypothetical protein [Candidatus Woesearchaeota archaeon]